MTRAITCPECGRDLPADAAFCMGCGHRLDAAAEHRDAPAEIAPQRATTAAATAVCPSCGLAAPTEKEDCALCGASIQDPLQVPHGDEFWVAVRCHFQCRSCGHLSPLNSLDMDGSVQCHRCGLDQAFDADAWEQGLAHCHAVGDLAGPEPEGRHPHPVVALLGLNPFADIGVTRTFSALNLSGSFVRDGLTVTRSLRIDAGPGHPLCPRCRTPLAHEVRDPRLHVSCPECGHRATYDTPLRAVEFDGGLRGVLAEGLRADQLQVKAAPHGGVIALSCPSCGAGLTDLGDGSVVTCTFCNTTARIPDRLMLRYMDRKPRAETWWMLFAGPSRRRRELEEGEPGTADGGNDEDAEAGGATGGDGEAPIRGIERAAEVPAPRAIRLLVGTLVPALFVLATMLLAFFDRIMALLR